LEFAAVQLHQPIKELRLCLRNGQLEILDMFLCEFISVKEFIDLFMSAEYSILALEWTFSKEHFKGGNLFMSFALPTGVGHFDLVHVSQEGVHPIVSDLVIMWCV
jgi:hypothetical protein